MGGENSKDGDIDAPSKLFNGEERNRIHEVFCNITNSEKSGTKEHLQVFLDNKLPPGIIDKLGSSVIKYSKQNKSIFTEAGLTALLAHLFKGTLEEKSEVVLLLMSGKTEANCTQVTEFVSNIVGSYVTLVQETKQVKSWTLNTSHKSLNNLALFLLQDLFHSDPYGRVSDTDVSKNSVYGQTEVEKWLSQCPLLLHVIDLVFHTCFKIDPSVESSERFITPIIPVVNEVNWAKNQTILDVPSLLLLTYSLPKELQGEWRPLFCNYLHGDSFSQLQTRMVKHGPTVIIIRDKEGHVFGGFASVSWDIRPQFVGTPTCFLFSLCPRCGVYTTTGYNFNYMYLNHGVQTLPNGLGMGGQLDYFGLWIDQSFDRGHSKAGPKCTTYNSPQLSKSAEFEVDVIEAWGVGPPPKLDEQATAARKSILDKDPEAKAILSLIDRGPVSEGLREGDDTADSPEQHELPPL